MKWMVIKMGLNLKEFVANKRIHQLFFPILSLALIFHRRHQYRSDENVEAFTYTAELLFIYCVTLSCIIITTSKLTLTYSRSHVQTDTSYEKNHGNCLTNN